MHIEQVIIKGFKTYKDQTKLTEDFSQHANIVVGYNGSGKSNFFNAILFVLSDEFDPLRGDKRATLLHEGSGQAVMSAFVEIVFNNQDGRIPWDDAPLVSIRRTIGLMKDDYSVNKRICSRQDVFNMLESAGFTKSNPYYIVKQGKIQELTMMDDVQRLNLIREISGASVFDERRKESERNLNEATQKKEKAAEMLTHIEARLQQLHNEQQDLKNYQLGEKKKRSLEFIMNNKQKEAAEEKLKEVEVEKDKLQSALATHKATLNTIRDEFRDLTTKVETSDNQLFMIERERKQKEQAHRQFQSEYELMKSKHDTEVRVAESLKENMQKLEIEEAQMQAQADAEEEGIRKEEPYILVQRETTRMLHQKLSKMQNEKNQLQEKSDRKIEYATLDERNIKIREQIELLNTEISEKKESMKNVSNEVDRVRRELQLDKEKLSRALDEKNKSNQQFGEDIQREENEIRRKIKETEDRLRTANQRHKTTESNYKKVTNKLWEHQQKLDQLQGRQAIVIAEVNTWAKHNNVSHKVYGTMLENIQVDREYFVAVESIAAGSLWHILVQDDEVGHKIMEYVRSKQLGRVEVVPLDKLRNDRYPYFTDFPGARPIIDVIDCKEVVRPAIKQAFRGWMLCDSLDIAERVVKQHRCSAITLEGDRITGNGAITGGYIDQRRFQRLAVQEDVKNGADQKWQLGRDKEQLEADIKTITNEQMENYQKKEIVVTKRQEHRKKIDSIAQQAAELENKVSTLVKSRQRLEERLYKLQSEVDDVDNQITSKEMEMRQPLGSNQLTEDERRTLIQLEKDVETQQKKLEMEEAELQRLSAKLSERENKLSKYLRVRLREIENDLMKYRAELHSKDEQTLADRAAEFLQRKETTHAELQALDHHRTEVVAEVNMLKEAMEKAQLEEQKAQDEVNNFDSKMQSFSINYSNLFKLKSEAEDKIRELGNINPTELQQFEGLSRQQVTREFKKVQEDMQKYNHINKKAIDQYTSFSDQITNLRDHQAAMHRTEQKLRAWIEEIDQKKEETLHTTLQNVNNHFEQVFGELVRDGKASMKSVKDEEKINGVAISVSFTGQDHSFLPMNQLSGGQKTVVALSIVFAIQRMEPAPFYLFDEIDANLDTMYRSAVATLVAKDARKSQMILTTFRPELLETADKFYQVVMRNRCSRIDCVTKKQAKKAIFDQSVAEGRKD